jgi:hypothetical protein
VVTEIKADFDPWGGEYTYVSFGYRLPMPTLPTAVANAPLPKQIAYKHAFHLIIPKEKWSSQYNMWDKFHLVVRDDGAVEVKKAD